MRVGRTILAFLIALSVALLPAAAGAGVNSSSPEQADMAGMDMAGMDMAAMEGDCCPHKATPCDQADACGTMATCALKCFSFTGASWSTVAFPSRVAELTAPFAGDSFPSHTGSPPFRPPRA